MSTLSDYTIEIITFSTISPFIEKYHYSKKTKGLKVQICFGLFRPGKFGIPELVGGIIYALPAMPHASQKYYPSDPSATIELVRLCCVDDTPKNTESYFISSTIRYLKKNTEFKVIISYADPEFGHSGIIYRATNFILFGMTGSKRKITIDGDRFHERILTDTHPYAKIVQERLKNKDTGIKIGKTVPKYIYVLYLNKREHAKYKNKLRNFVEVLTF